MFDAAMYQERRQKLARRVGSGVILLLGNNDSPMNYTDNIFPFRQDSTFLYFFGIDLPGFAALIDIDKQTETIFADDFTIDDIVWMGVQPKVAELAARAGISDSLPFSKLAARVKSALDRKQPLHFLNPYRHDHILLLQEMLDLQPAELNTRASVDLTRGVIAQRSYKSESELREIEEAISVSYDMHLAALRSARPGKMEYETVAAIEAAIKRRHSQISFPIIFSIHGETLHNHAHHNKMQAGDMIVHDSGAESLLHYASDITRTIPVGGKFDSRQAELYDVVLQAEEAAIVAVKPGVPFRDIHLQACRDLAEGLKAVGLMQGDLDEAVAAGAHAMFFQCGLGHMMGLDAHDMENLGEQDVGYGPNYQRSDQFGLKYLRLARELEEGFVITVEPGLYFVPELMDLWQAQGLHRAFINYDMLQKYRDFGGIRVEDDVVVTADGYRVLGKSIPKKRQEVEALASE